MDRFNYINEQLSKYILNRKITPGYASYTFDITISKDCPMRLRVNPNEDESVTFTGKELCEFVDGSRYNWGWSFTGKQETLDGIHYYGKICID